MNKRKFPIREVCSFLEIRAHVIRYWEKEIPLLSPKKSITGHREYTLADLELLFRIKHLLHEKGYTLAGVRKRLWDETSADYQDVKAHISAIRVELVELLRQSTAMRKRIEELKDYAE